MIKSYSFWFKVTIAVQLLTAAAHSVGLFIEPVPADETEKQLFDLMINYRTDAGAGFTPSYMELYTALSSCFSLLYLLGGLINIQLLRIKLSPASMKGILNINILVFGITFLVMLFNTFLPPIILTGLVLLLLLTTRITIKEG